MTPKHKMIEIRCLISVLERPNGPLSINKTKVDH